MKVYRFCNWSVNPYDGSLNEKYNLIQLGLISPSNNYLRKDPIFQDGINTFGENMPMSKYFFPSLADTLYTAYPNKEREITLMELDIPNSLLLKNIGLGYYESLQVEYCIPYQEMYQFLAQDFNDYTLPSLAFYNDNMYKKKNLSHLKEYQELEKLLAKVKDISYIYQENRLSIYPLFCFTPKNINYYVIPKENSKYFKEIAKKIKAVREDRYCFEAELKRITQAREDLFFFDHDFSKDELFRFTHSIIEEENKELRKILFKK